MDIVAGERGWWPVDKVISAYFAAAAVFIFWFHELIPDAWELLAWHVLGIVLILAAIRYGNPVTFAFRHWYPLPYVASCYKEMSTFIHSVRRTDFDAALARVDFNIWSVHPTVWLERIQSRPLTEILEILYSLFVPAVLFVAFVLWRRREYAAFRFYAFLIALGFLVSYIGYYIVPARGPRFLLASLQSKPLEGLWLYNGLRIGLDRLESAHFDCFPSGHTELTILACWGSRLISPKLFRAYFAYTLSIIFATVYLRYHYTVDVLAGIAVAVALLLVAPFAYRALGGAWRPSEARANTLG